MPKSTAPQLQNVFFERWKNSGGAEMANCQSFINELCAFLEVEHPMPTQQDELKNDYVFERSVTFEHPDGTTSTGRIDLYKRDCFVLEAKQGADRQASPANGDRPRKPKPKPMRKGTAQRGTDGWDYAMLAAHGQAAGYAQAIARAHGAWVPFLIVLDIGHEFHIYADFSKQNHGYRPYPDPGHNRIPFADLEKPETAELFRAIWNDPWSLNPAVRRTRVTKEIAGHLAGIAKSLDAAGHNPKEASEFLMRAVFTMFSEDVGLLPKDSFLDMLVSLRGQVDQFPSMVEHLWRSMDKGEFSPIIRRKLLEFNGGLFQGASALPITDDQLEEFIAAANAEWQDVEPAIFGTLLERALDPATRHSYGAHFTPREYVERLVMPVVIDPLRDEWESVIAAAVALSKRGDQDKAISEVKAFLERLCKIRVLDPACGSANFLYVTLEHLKMLEGEVFQALRDLGCRNIPKNTVTPEQLLGLEVNERAAIVGDLVLWIGYLQWHYRVHPGITPPEPVMNKFRNIEFRDAVLTYERKRPLKGKNGKIMTRWDGVTFKEHQTTAEKVPDETSVISLYEYENPKPATWPNADYIVGNPPFIGAGPMRSALGDGYVEAIRAAHCDVPESVDFVVYWWNQAAKLLREGKIKRFGFIATNSLKQTFNRRVVEHHLQAQDGLSLTFAIPDHPWVDTADGAAVRISMTVATAGKQNGILAEAVEDGGRTFLISQQGRINADLSIGTDVTLAAALQANRRLASRGVQLMGAGFIVSPEEAKRLGLGRRKGIERHLRPYLNGRDLTQRSRAAMVIDLYGLSSDAVRQQYPEIYQHLVERVKPERDVNRRKAYRENWWIHGEPRSAFRPALDGLERYIATVETAKHRVFVFINGDVLPDNKLVVIASDDAYVLGVASSHIHVAWALRNGSTLEDRPVYTKSVCFDTFPFPDATVQHQKAIRHAAEQIEGHRWERLRENPDTLTITGIYNVMDKLRAGMPLNEAEQTLNEQGLVSVLLDLHNRLNEAVATAYGWPLDISEPAILTNLLELNKRRAQEEANGSVRYLRVAYQTGGQGELDLAMEGGSEEMTASNVSNTKITPVPWPTSMSEQVAAVRRLIETASMPVTLPELRRYFTRVNVEVLEDIVQVLASLGKAESLGDGKYSVPRPALEVVPNQNTSSPPPPTAAPPTSAPTASAKVRYLTKSRYKLALECPTKLFYTGKPKEFVDNSLDDAFLQALARGGFQVGAMAQHRYPGGTEVKSKKHEEAVAETSELMKAKNVTIYEAAFRFGSLFVRVDVLIKKDNTLRLLEVKAKSFDPELLEPFLDSRDETKLKSTYAQYLYDVAFQTHVVKSATGLDVVPHLVFANKKAKAKVDGLNQRFLIQREGTSGSKVIVKHSPTTAEIGDLLIEVDVSRFVSLIQESSNRERTRLNGLPFTGEAELFAKSYAEDQRIAAKPGRHCKHCQFRAKSGESRSGFNKCWTTEGKLKPTDVTEPFAFDVWNIHYAKSDAVINRGTPLMRDIAREDLANKASKTKAKKVEQSAEVEMPRDGLGAQERQWLQVEAVTKGAKTPYIDHAGITRALSAWVYPLHFIDFETAATAIPFTRGMRPYEPVAFQFSHHMVHRDGTVEHASEYIHDKVGEFPNFDFVRALKAALDKDSGTIFRYAAHENTILCRIHAQLGDSAEPDAEELMAWIETITNSPGYSARKWSGPRSMVDLKEIVKNYLYLPDMGGSISIKKVLPAILNEPSDFRTRFEAPVYGAKAGVKSLNFRNWTWIRFDEQGKILDPYKTLDPVFKDIPTETLDLLTDEDDELADGGAAMTAYAMMQFTEMSRAERKALQSALLRYCELDTLAMVFLYQYLREVTTVKEKSGTAA